MAGLTPEPGLILRPHHPLQGLWLHPTSHFALSSTSQPQCLCSCSSVRCLECPRPLVSSYSSFRPNSSISSGKPSSLLQRKSSSLLWASPTPCMPLLACMKARDSVTSVSLSKPTASLEPLTVGLYLIHQRMLSPPFRDWQTRVLSGY